MDVHVSGRFHEPDAEACQSAPCRLYRMFPLAGLIRTPRISLDRLPTLVCAESLTASEAHTVAMHINPVFTIIKHSVSLLTGPGISIELLEWQPHFTDDELVDSLRVGRFKSAGTGGRHHVILIHSVTADADPADQ